MKLNPDNMEDAARIARYLAGEMDVDERLRFEDETGSEAANTTILSAMKTIFDKASGLQPDKQPDTKQAWRKLHARLESDNLLAQNPAERIRKPSRTWMRMAAAIIVIVAFGTVIYISQKKPSLPRLLSINTMNEKSTLVKTLADGSIVYLAPGATFSYPETFTADTRGVELRGEAFFDIASNPKIPFVIKTNSTIVTVLGTAFNIRTSNHDNFELTVDRGKVKVEMKGNPAQMQFVAAGEQVVADKQSLRKTKPVFIENRTWYRAKMQFKDEKLRNIISVLNRNFATNFALAGNDIGNRRLTVTFDNETPETMTELICLTLNLKSEKSNGSVVLFDRN